MNLCWFRKKTTRTLYFVLYFVWEGSVWTQMRTGEQKRQKKIQVKTGVNERKGAEWEVRPGWSSDRIKSQRHEMWLNFNEEKHVRKWHRKKWTKGPPRLPNTLQKNREERSWRTLEAKEESKTSDWAEGEKKSNLLRLWSSNPVTQAEQNLSLHKHILAEKILLTRLWRWTQNLCVSESEEKGRHQCFLFVAAAFYFSDRELKGLKIKSHGVPKVFTWLSIKTVVPGFATRGSNSKVSPVTSYAPCLRDIRQYGC